MQPACCWDSLEAQVEIPEALGREFVFGLRPRCLMTSCMYILYTYATHNSHHSDHQNNSTNTNNDPIHSNSSNNNTNNNSSGYGNGSTGVILTYGPHASCRPSFLTTPRH